MGKKTGDDAGEKERGGRSGDRARSGGENHPSFPDGFYGLSARNIKNTRAYSRARSVLTADTLRPLNVAIAGRPPLRRDVGNLDPVAASPVCPVDFESTQIGRITRESRYTFAIRITEGV